MKDRGRPLSFCVKTSFLATTSLFVTAFFAPFVLGEPSSGSSGESKVASVVSERLTLLDLAADPPTGPNPYLSFLPHDARPDWDLHRAQAILDARRRAAMLPKRGPGIALTESEAPDRVGLNDLPEIADVVPGFGTRPGEVDQAEISGVLRDPPLVLALSTEPDDTLSQARALTLLPNEEVAVEGTIGDGAWGSSGAGTPASGGDFDLYRFDALAGQTFDAAARTPEPLAALDPILALYDAAGNVLAFNDHRPASGIIMTFDSLLEFTFEADGTYYLLVGGHAALAPTQDELAMLPHPQVAGSGPGAQSEGIYTLRLALDLRERGDRDVFALHLRAGDVFGANLLGGGREMLLRDPAGEERIGSTVDASGIFPEASPLPGGGEASLAEVIDQDGRWTLEVRRAGFFDGGDYLVETSVFRNAFEFASTGSGDPAVQVLFLDFDGASLDTSIFRPNGEPVILSPLSSFLPRWGLGNRESEVIDAILDVVEEKLSEEIRLRGGNGDFRASGHFGEFDIEIRNSRDHADPFGEAGVSRVIVGGSIEELGFPTIGIAESIDPGNFVREESAVVLLDLLSDPPGSPDSLRTIPRAAGTPLLRLVAHGIGTIVAHEAGHFFANFHTAREGEIPVDLPTIMDRGGLLASYLGVGEDGVFGTDDDIDPLFGPDEYSPAEFFTGTEHTLERISFGLPAGGPHAVLTISPSFYDFGPLAVGAIAQVGIDVGNAGTLDLSLGEATLAGDPAFSLVAGTAPDLLAPGTSRLLTAAFAPLVEGPGEALVTIPSDDPRHEFGTVELVGQGGVPEASLVCGGGCSFLDFGTLVFSEEVKALRRSIALGNLGTGLLQYEILFAGRDQEAFGVDGEIAGSLAPGEERALELFFSPESSVEDHEASLLVVSNDPAMPLFEVPLAGFAVGSDLAVDPPSPFFLGNVELGFSRTRTFALQNLGNATLHIESTRLTGENAAEMEILAGAPVSVAAGEAADLTVRFEPISIGPKRAAIEILSNDRDDSRKWFFLGGNGTASHLLVDHPVLDFGRLDPGEKANATLRVSNAGDAPLRVTESPIVGPDAEAFTILFGGAPFGITTAKRRIELSYEPTTIGPHRAYLVLESNDPDEPVFWVPLLGESGDLVEIPVLSPFGVAFFAILLLFCALRQIFSHRIRQEG